MTPTEEEAKQGDYNPGAMLPIEQEVARGLRFAHLMLFAIERKSKEAARLTEELSKLLIAKGITSDTGWAELLENPVHIPDDFSL
jgi:hypothetical protein